MSLAAAAPFALFDISRNGSSFAVKFAPRSMVDDGGGERVNECCVHAARTYAGQRAPSCLSILNFQGPACYFWT